MSGFSIDLSGYKNSVKEIKDVLRYDTIYGNDNIVIRERVETSTGGYDGLYDIGNNTTEYIDTVLFGIQEVIPKGYEKRYVDLIGEDNGDIKFTLSVADGERLLEAMKDSKYNVYIDSVVVGGQPVEVIDDPDFNVDPEIESNLKQWKWIGSQAQFPTYDSVNKRVYLNSDYVSVYLDNMYAEVFSKDYSYSIEIVVDEVSGDSAMYVVLDGTIVDTITAVGTYNYEHVGTGIDNKIQLSAVASSYPNTGKTYVSKVSVLQSNISEIGKEVEMVSFDNCIFNIETVVYLNIKG